MTANTKVLKRCHPAGLMLRCSGAVFTGLLIVSVITLGLLVISGGEEAPVKTASYTIQFPEDEQMLKDLSRQLIKQAELDALSDIEPASGTVTPDAKPAATAALVPAQ